MNKKLAFTQIAMLFLSFDVFAAKGFECNELGPDSGQMALKICIKEGYHKADVQLNKVYRQALGKIRAMAKSMDDADGGKWGDNFKNALVVSQRRWVKFKESYCNNVHEYLGWRSSGLGTEKNDCLTRLTLERTIQIKEDFNIK